MRCPEKNITLYDALLKTIPLLWLLLLFACQHKYSSTDHPGYFRPFFQKVDAADGAGKTEAIALMDEAFAKMDNPGLMDIAGVLIRKRDFFFMVKREINYANTLNDSLILLLEPRIDEEKYAIEYARSLFRKGDFLMAQKKYDESFRFFFLGKQIVNTKVKNTCALAGYSGRIGMLFYAQGKYHLAASYFYENYQEIDKCENDKFFRFASMQESLDNVGICYNKVGMLDSATYFLNSTLDFIKTHESSIPEKHYYISVAKAVVYSNQADVLSKQGKFEAAEILFKQSIDTMGNYDNNFSHNSMARLAETYLLQRKMTDAEKLLLQLKYSIDSFPDETALIQWYRLKKDFYVKQGNIPAAFEYQERYHAAKDSAEEADKKFNAMDISREFENREQKALNKALQDENRQKNIYVLIAVIASAMAIAIVVLIWQNLKRTRKHVHQLEELNSEINRTNGDLQKAFSSLEQSHHENNRIIKIVAHDLKNPISAINNLVHSLLKKSQPDDLKEILELIQNACVNSISLIKDLLSEKKKLADIKRELVDLGGLLEQCVELLQARADEKNQQLTLKADHAIVMLNRQKIWRVISNIVTNAIKFSPENATIDINLQRKKDTVLLSVHDYGIGIPSELKDKIFELAPEASRTGTAGEESHGLGLSITQKIIEEHHGRIWFESEAGEGSVFYVELPYAN